MTCRLRAPAKPFRGSYSRSFVCIRGRDFVPWAQDRADGGVGRGPGGPPHNNQGLLSLNTTTASGGRVTRML